MLWTIVPLWGSSSLKRHCLCDKNTIRGTPHDRIILRFIVLKTAFSLRRHCYHRAEHSRMSLRLNVFLTASPLWRKRFSSCSARSYPINIHCVCDYTVLMTETFFRAMLGRTSLTLIAIMTASSFWRRHYCLVEHGRALLMLIDLVTALISSRCSLWAPLTFMVGSNEVLRDVFGWFWSVAFLCVSVPV